MRKTPFLLAVLCLFTPVFSDFVPRNSIEFTLPIYRFFYSEEFDAPPPSRNGIPMRTFGFKRSDEYGLTSGFDLAFRHFAQNPNITFALSAAYTRAINHTYDGSAFYPSYVNFRNEEGEIREIWQIIPPLIVEDRDNFFWQFDAEIGYWTSNLSRRGTQILVTPKIIFSFNRWHRPVSWPHYYMYLRALPSVSLQTKNRENFGIISDIAISIPVWQQMIIDLTDGARGGKYYFDIGGRLGFNFNLGFARYYSQNRTLKIAFFHESFGFSESPPIEFGPVEGGLVLEPSSRTRNNGVRITFQKGFGT